MKITVHCTREPSWNKGTHLYAYFEFINSFNSPLHEHKQITAIKCAIVPPRVPLARFAQFTAFKAVQLFLYI